MDARELEQRLAEQETLLELGLAMAETLDLRRVLTLALEQAEQFCAAETSSIWLRINMDPGIVACNDPQRIYREIDRILDIAAGRPNCLMGTGCLPLETPPENVRLIQEYVA